MILGINEEKKMIVVVMLLFIIAAILNTVEFFYTIQISGEIISNVAIQTIVFLFFRVLIVIAILTEFNKGKKIARIAVIGVLVYGAFINAIGVSIIDDLLLIGILRTGVFFICFICTVLILLSKSINDHFGIKISSELASDENNVD